MSPPIVRPQIPGQIQAALLSQVEEITDITFLTKVQRSTDPWALIFCGVSSGAPCETITPKLLAATVAINMNGSSTKLGYVNLDTNINPILYARFRPMVSMV